MLLRMTRITKRRGQRAIESAWTILLCIPLPFQNILATFLAQIIAFRLPVILLIAHT